MEIIVPMLNLYQPAIVFKVLGTLRMLIDGQGDLSLKLLGDANLIERLVDWAFKSPDMTGVNSEASRLIAWLVKNAYRSRDGTVSLDSLNSFVKSKRSVEVLVKMLTATHVVMQNEAVIALTIIAIAFENSENFLSMLINANLAGSIQEFIGRISEMERITNEIIDNLVSFISVLKKSEPMNKYLDEARIDEKSIPRVKELATL